MWTLKQRQGGLHCEDSDHAGIEVFAEREAIESGLDSGGSTRRASGGLFVHTALRAADVVRYND